MIFVDQNRCTNADRGKLGGGLDISYAGDFLWSEIDLFKYGFRSCTRPLGFSEKDESLFL
jgi:hypothetical protein